MTSPRMVVSLTQDVSTCRLVRPPTSRKNRGKLFYVTQMKNDMLLMTVPTSLGHR